MKNSLAVIIFLLAGCFCSAAIYAQEQTSSAKPDDRPQKVENLTPVSNSNTSKEGKPEVKPSCNHENQVKAAGHSCCKSNAVKSCCKPKSAPAGEKSEK